MLADEVGLDVFGVGEHHRPDFAVSSPAVVLAAAAVRTTRIRLTSAVTVLSSDDPVRVFQDFATVDLLSQGRAEIMAGRGSFIESFPLFGYDLDHYDELFSEKLGLLLALRESERVTWSGRHRAPIDDLGVYPRPEQNPLPVWIAVGGTPAVGRPGRHPRPPPGDRDHRGRPGALPPAGGPAPRRRPCGGARCRRDPRGHQHPRLRRRHLAARGGRVLPALRAHHERDRPRARLEPHDPGAVRGHALAPRRPRGGQPRGGGREDPRPAPDLREPAVPDADERRHHAARRSDALDRALRDPWWRRSSGPRWPGARRRRRRRPRGAECARGRSSSTSSGPASTGARGWPARWRRSPRATAPRWTPTRSPTPGAPATSPRCRPSATDRGRG